MNSRSFVVKKTKNIDNLLKIKMVSIKISYPISSTKSTDTILIEPDCFQKILKSKYKVRTRKREIVPAGKYTGYGCGPHGLLIINDSLYFFMPCLLSQIAQSEVNFNIVRKDQEEEYLFKDSSECIKRKFQKQLNAEYK
jgi:hypothetical protein